MSHCHDRCQEPFPPVLFSPLELPDGSVTGLRARGTPLTALLWSLPHTNNEINLMSRPAAAGNGCCFGVWRPPCLPVLRGGAARHLHQRALRGPTERNSRPGAPPKHCAPSRL